MLLTAHDCSHNTYDWADFTMQQKCCDMGDPLLGTVRYSNDRNGKPWSVIEWNFTDRPMIGSEDIWDTDTSPHLTREEIRRVAWGEMLAGVMPLHSEWSSVFMNDKHPDPQDANTPGYRTGEQDIIAMFDFFYENPHHTLRYRSYEQKNALVSGGDGEVCSGVTGEEYLAYNEDGGDVDLEFGSETDSGWQFSVVWFDPVGHSYYPAAPVYGGATRTLTPPFGGDSVVLVYR